MPQRQKSWKGKKHYLTYKISNLAKTNKLKKLTRHCKKYPKDKQSQESLEKIKIEPYNGRKRPNIPGSNPTIPNVKSRKPWEIPSGYRPALTAGEQLSVLLDIALPKRRKKKKAKIVTKKKKHVRT